MKKRKRRRRRKESRRKRRRRRWGEGGRGGRQWHTSFLFNLPPIFHFTVPWFRENWINLIAFYFQTDIFLFFFLIYCKEKNRAIKGVALCLFTPWWGLPNWGVEISSRIKRNQKYEIIPVARSLNPTPIPSISADNGEKKSTLISFTV